MRAFSLHRPPLLQAFAALASRNGVLLLDTKAVPIDSLLYAEMRPSLTNSWLGWYQSKYAAMLPSQCPSSPCPVRAKFNGYVAVEWPVVIPLPRHTAVDVCSGAFLFDQRNPTTFNDGGQATPSKTVIFHKIQQTSPNAGIGFGTRCSKEHQRRLPSAGWEKNRGLWKKTDSRLWASPGARFSSFCRF